MNRRAFTLVELLVVVLIICILATITLFALFNAGEHAKAARTKAQIAKIHDLIVPIWESYITRRVPIYLGGVTDQKTAAQIRVDGIRELMRMELPDRYSDVMKSDGSKIDKNILTVHPSLYEAYHRKATSVSWHSHPAKTEHQGAECLYLILSRIQDGESNGLEHFTTTEIGDVDGDKMPEILDGWGVPIRFLRWAPGWLDPLSSLQRTTEQDQLDPLGVKGAPPATYALFPLIMSAGPDNQWDVVFDGATAIDYSSSPANDPFAMRGLPKRIGSPDDNNGNNGGTPKEHVDNITNHLTPQ